MKNVLLSLTALGLFLVATTTLHSHTYAAQQDEQAILLEEGLPLSGALAGGGAAHYRVGLLTREYLHVEVKQRGINVVVLLLGPDGAELARMDGQDGTAGAEEVSCEATQSGWYRVEILPKERAANQGSYQVSVQKARRVTSTERARIAAERLYSDGRLLYERSGTSEALRLGVKKYEAALVKWQEARDRKWEGLTLISLGTTLSVLSEHQAALVHFDQALAISRELNDRTIEVGALSGSAMAYNELSQYQKAQQAFVPALALMRELKDRGGEGATLNSLGILYARLGQDEKAQEAFEQALRIMLEVHKQYGEVAALVNLGFVYERLQQYDKAQRTLQQVLAVATAANDEEGQAAILSGLGRICSKLNQPAKAESYHNQALALWRKRGNQSGEAGALNNLGQVNLDMGQYQKAEKAFEQALVITREISDKDAEGQILTNLMRLWRQQGKRPLAIFCGKQAVNVYQDIRSHIQKLEKELQQSFLHTKEDTYRILADLLISEGRIAEAEQVLGMLKKEEYFDYLRRDDKVAKELLSGLSLTSTERDAFARYETFANELTKLGKEAGELEVEGRNYEAGKFPGQARLDALDKQIADANKVFDTFIDQLKVKFGENDKRVDVLDSSQALLQELNQPHTVIIATIVGEDRLNLIVTTAGAPRAHTVDIKASELNELVEAFRSAVKNPSVDPHPLGRKLYDVLFPTALQKDLENIKADTIVWSLDGTLRYAPIAALWDGKQYLAERYANVVITLASRDNLKLTPSDRSKWQVLGVGVSKKFEDFDALTAVPEELCGIVFDPQTEAGCAALTKGKSAGVIAGRSLLDEEFTLQAFKSNLGRYAVVHVASHFSLNPGNETNSYLLLGGGQTDDERKLTIDVVRSDFKTKFVGVELLTLSACNTAMTAGDKSNGVEIEGFGTLAQKEGAKAVLATLWSVADVSTRELMTTFYQIYKNNPNITKAEALRLAQLSLLRGNNKTNGPEATTQRTSQRVGQKGAAGSAPPFKPDPNAKYSHPYYWAPFILIGNWR